ncbi:MAG: hypothetical protein OIN90_19985 [Candidatus Methanoperedens sp.]|nr:hypothetical protein [Candidatus Methanoperedens sp.]
MKEIDKIMLAITNGENQNAYVMRRPTDDETQEIYKIYCQLATIIHDYAVGCQLYKNSCYSWAITVNYYSLMHCGRFICLIGIKKFPKSHKRLNEFLSGQQKFENISLNGLFNILKKFTNDTKLEIKIKTLGNKLKKIKELREDNSYEFFIISHQINHSVLKTEFPKVYNEIRKLNEESLKFVLELLVAYINSLDYKDYFIGFLKDTDKNYPWAFSDLIHNLSIQNIDTSLIKDISDLIDENLLNKLDDGILLEDSFFNPIKYNSFTDKSEKMRNFMDRIKALIGDS